jgi:hypothetical protein
MPAASRRHAHDGEQIISRSDHTAAMNGHPLSSVPRQELIAHVQVSLLAGQEIGMHALPLFGGQVSGLGAKHGRHLATKGRPAGMPATASE